MAVGAENEGTKHLLIMNVTALTDLRFFQDIFIDERYRIDYKIGEGGFGLVYAGTDTQLNDEVAIKLTHVNTDPEILKAEADTYKGLSAGVGIPRVRWFGEECDYYALVHELLGPSLEDLFNYCDRRFSIKTFGNPRANAHH
ncbi:casein kinase I [Beauveria bassiana ARSEF 2860]|uniref:Casein kinase I n=1 Tax=Beauveria bassiana (strain ARSEF 2860) TaxID=655819 RepID=J5J3D1_BEAB2|nr:casein kinase I [Beauveria bassiana ARSEF 2860]EJP61248.1 casein kinase I [Beauveria bassiana ARSEF 2860]